MDSRFKGLPIPAAIVADTKPKRLSMWRDTSKGSNNPAWRRVLPDGTNAPEPGSERAASAVSTITPAIAPTQAAERSAEDAAAVATNTSAPTLAAVQSPTPAVEGSMAESASIHAAAAEAARSPTPTPTPAETSAVKTAVVAPASVPPFVAVRGAMPVDDIFPHPPTPSPEAVPVGGAAAMDRAAPASVIFSEGIGSASLPATPALQPVELELQNMHAIPPRRTSVAAVPAVLALPSHPAQLQGLTAAATDAEGALSSTAASDPDAVMLPITDATNAGFATPARRAEEVPGTLAGTTGQNSGRKLRIQEIVEGIKVLSASAKKIDAFFAERRSSPSAVAAVVAPAQRDPISPVLMARIARLIDVAREQIRQRPELAASAAAQQTNEAAIQPPLDDKAQRPHDSGLAREQSIASPRSSYDADTHASKIKRKEPRSEIKRKDRRAPFRLDFERNPGFRNPKGEDTKGGKTATDRRDALSARKPAERAM